MPTDDLTWMWPWVWCWQHSTEIAVGIVLVGGISFKVPPVGGVVINLTFPFIAYPVLLFTQQLQDKVGFLGAIFMKWLIGSQIGVPLPVVCAIPFLIAYAAAFGMTSESKLKWLSPISCAISAWFIFGILGVPVIYFCWWRFKRMVITPKQAVST